MPYQHGEIHWVELNTRDVAKARTYYSKIYGWSWDEMPMADEAGTYYVAKSGDEMVAGMFDMTQIPGMENMPAHWLIYLAVDDVDAAAAETAAMGGTVLREPWDVPGVGRVAIILDPGGAGLGIMTPSD